MENFIVYLKVAGAIFLWSGIPITGHILAEKGIDVFRISFVRFAIATLLLWSYLFTFGRHIPRRISLKTAGGILLASFFGLFVHNILIMSGIVRLPASETNAILATTPAFVAIASVLFYQEELSLINWLGIAISCLGALTVITNGNWSTIMQLRSTSGILFLVAAMIDWTIYVMITKKQVEQNKLDFTVLFAYCFSAATVMFFLSMPFWPQSTMPFSAWVSSKTILWCLAAFVISTVFPYPWTAEGVEKIGAAHTTIFANLLPIFGIMQALVILSEKPTLMFYVGTTITMIGIILVTGVPARETSQTKISNTHESTTNCHEREIRNG